MKKIIYIIALTVISAMPVGAQMHFGNKPAGYKIGVGMRVGLGSMMQKSDEESSDHNSGFDGALEGVYTYYFSQSRSTLPQFGIRTGLSMGFRQNSITMDNIDIEYQTADASGNTITYHATAEDVKETDRQLSLEIPVMCAMSYNRLFANLGIRAGIPFMSRYQQTMKNATLTASYEDYGVTIEGEKVTGRLTNEDNKQKAKLDASSFNLCLSLEAGYVFHVLGSRLEGGIYVDYGLVDNYKGKGENFTDADPSTINGATSTPTKVVVHSLTDSYVDNVGVFCAGLRAVYTIAKSSDKKRNNSSPRGIFR